MKSTKGILIVLAVFTTACTGTSKPSPIPVLSATCSHANPASIPDPCPGISRRGNRHGQCARGMGRIRWLGISIGLQCLERLNMNCSSSIREPLSLRSTGWLPRHPTTTIFRPEHRSFDGLDLEGAGESDGRWRAWSETRMFNIERDGA